MAEIPTPVGYYCDHSDEPRGQRTHEGWAWTDDSREWMLQPDTISAHGGTTDWDPERRVCPRAVPVYAVDASALTAQVERLTAERDRIAEVREAAVREAKRERDAHDQTAAELKRAEAERDEARILMERLRNGLATAHENSAHWGRLVSRYYSAWQSARRGRREMRTERGILCAAMELAHSLAAKKGAEVERLRGEIGGLHETVEQADADRDRLTEQVRVLTIVARRGSPQAACSTHPSRAPGCDICRDVEVLRAALEETEAGRG